MDFYQKLKEYFENTPADVIKDKWERTKEFDKIGITAKKLVENLTINDVVQRPYQVRYKCLLCGRDKFRQRQAHNCVGGYRKRKIEWQTIIEH